MKILNNKHIPCLMAALLLGLLACTPENPSDSVKQTTIRVSVLPDRNGELLKSKYQAILIYLSTKTTRNYQLIIPKNYDHALQMFLKKESDLAFFGGYTFVKANFMGKALPLVSRNTDKKFTSVVLVSTTNQAQTLEDLKGSSFSFGSTLSTSGHLMPRSFFKDLNILPESFFSSVTYSGAHDKTILQISQGKVNAGVANVQIYKNMLKDGRITNEDVRVLWSSPEFQDYVWAFQNDMEAALINDIRNAFLAMSLNEPTSKKILNDLDAGFFVPVSMDDFEILQNVISELDM